MALETAYGVRMFNPGEQDDALDRLVGVRSQWAEQDDTVVFTAGGYDLMHLNHIGSLLGAKILGVRHRYEISGHSERSWTELSAEKQREIITANLEEDKVKLVVSVKGDQELAAKKSFQKEKGNMPRPIQDWQTRARSVLSVGMPDYYGFTGHLVDAVTIDDNVDVAFEGTPNWNLTEVVHELRPDVWQIYAESKNLLRFAASGALAGNVRVFVSDIANYYTDSSSGEPLSTTFFVKKVLGQIPVRHTMEGNDRHTT
jgi:hypothetical protein